MITNSKAVEEIWKIREAMAEPMKDMTPSEQLNYLSETGRELAEKLGLPTLEPKPIHQ